MTQEEKQLLLKDLYARLPYGVKIRIEGKPRILFGIQQESVIVRGRDENGYCWNEYNVEEWNIKPYLRPMSSMTDEEREDVREKFFDGSDHYDIDDIGEIYADTYQPYTTVYTLSFARLSGYIDWLNEHHFDYRGLIEKGFALEAPEGMYKTE